MEDKIKILLIEDNPGDARLVSIYLNEPTSDKFIFSSAGNLEKGLELLSKETFDVIILDLTLPDSSGLDTFKKAYEHSPGIPIIVLTGLEDELVGINAMKLGAQDFLTKGSFNPKELKRSVNYSIERYKLLKDLSENVRKLAEKSLALEREQQKLENAQKLAHIGSWDWDIIKNSITWSEELCRIYGVTCPVSAGDFELFLDRVHPKDREYVKTTIEEAVKNFAPLNFKHRIIFPNRGERMVHVIGETVKGDDGKPLRIQGTVQDITERFHGEELEKLVLAATQSYNSVIIFDRDEKVEWVNEGFIKLTGYTLEELKTLSIEILRKGNKDGAIQQKKRFQKILKLKKPVVYENKNYTKQGKEYWVITTATPIFDKNGEVERIIVIDSDITERKKIERKLVEANIIAERSIDTGNKAIDELMKAKKQLEESMKVKEQFLANMSHEIRTPMNAIVGFTDLILKTELTPEQKQYIDAVKISGKNLLIIVNDILDFSKIQSGKLAFEQTEFYLSQVISTLTDLMLPKSSEKNIRLSAKIDSTIPDRLIGDPTRLSQIFLNLVGNAIKFTNKGEIRITADLLSETNDTVELEFSVIDTGIGIPEDKFTTIFEGFTQASNEITRKYGGTGLGLTIAKQFVELQGGTISVESTVGKGSKFTFKLKFKKSSTPESITKEPGTEPGTEILEGLHVLLVEDNLMNQILAKKVLSDWKFKTEVAENGLIAIGKLEKNNFDLILMDIQMPEMDGYETTRYIKEKFPSPKRDIPIIALTAHALAGEAEKCLQAGMNDYISKPFDQKVLYSKIVSAIKKNKSLKEIN